MMKPAKAKKPVRIEINNITKEFKIPHESSSSIKQTLLHFRRRGFETFKVLDQVSFEIYEGEFFGILGRNGSGKSTLLKLLANIYAPTAGHLKVHGSLTPFIELGVGFNPELTGRENVFLNGAILGLTTKEIEDKYGDIVAFSELERFMDQKLKNYSSGMQVRLAFSIAIHAHNNILLIDEVLAVGDESFQNKCLSVFNAIKKDPTKTVVFVSHDMGAVQRFCDRAVVIHDGKLAFVGDPIEAALEYRKLNFPDTVVEEKTIDEADQPVHAQLTSVGGRRKNLFEYNEKALLHISWEPDERIKNIGVALFSGDGQYMFGANTILDKVKLQGNALTYEVDLDVGGGRYNLQIGFFGETDADKVYFITKGPEFSVSSPITWQGATFLNHKWQVK